MSPFYKSLRVGRGGQTFHLLKFRTMRTDGGSPTAAVDDTRLTRIGRWLRRFKLDELPTLWNVLRGDVALVGPRPDVPSEIFDLDEITRTAVLTVKPGLVSPATLWDLNEDVALAGEPDPHKAYCEKIKPMKYRLNCWYVTKKSFLFDLRVLGAAALRIAGIKYDLFKVLPDWIKAYDLVQKTNIGD